MKVKTTAHSFGFMKILLHSGKLKSSTFLGIEMDVPTCELFGINIPIPLTSKLSAFHVRILSLSCKAFPFASSTAGLFSKENRDTMLDLRNCILTKVVDLNPK